MWPEVFKKILVKVQFLQEQQVQKLQLFLLPHTFKLNINIRNGLHGHLFLYGAISSQNRIVTVLIRSLYEGNVFSRVCQSVHLEWVGWVEAPQTCLVDDPPSSLEFRSQFPFSFTPSLNCWELTPFSRDCLQQVHIWGHPLPGLLRTFWQLRTSALLRSPLQHLLSSVRRRLPSTERLSCFICFSVISWLRKKWKYWKYPNFEACSWFLFVRFP